MAKNTLFNETYTIALLIINLTFIMSAHAVDEFNESTNWTIADHIVISEVLYDPISTESGGEAVELYNPTSEEVNISLWYLTTESSNTDAIVPQNTTIAPFGFYLIADTNWNTLRDNLSWPQADHEESITLKNTDSGVILKHSNGTILDTVGWGASPQGFYEGLPHEGVFLGYSLERLPGLVQPLLGNYVDTNNNSADFVERIPEPQSRLSPTEIYIVQTEPQNNNFALQNITTIAEVVNIQPEVVSIRIVEDFDQYLPGTQILPRPGEYRSIILEVVVTDENGISDIINVTGTLNNYSGTDDDAIFMRTEELNLTTGLFQGLLELPYFFTPGNNSITVVARDTLSQKKNATINFTYLPLLAFALDATQIRFNITPGQTTEVYGDLDESTTERATIRNIGNVKLDFSLSGTNLSSDELSIPVESISYNISSTVIDVFPTNSPRLLENMELVGVGLGFGAEKTMALNMMLTAPGGLDRGLYSGSVSIFGLSAQE